MNQSFVSLLLNDIETRHPQAFPGVIEARTINPKRFEKITEKFIKWAVSARGGEDIIPKIVDAFVLFSYNVNRAQLQYEVDGHYEHSSFQECYDACYNQEAFMDDYLWGIYLTNYLWVHHFEISLFYKDRFLSRIGSNTHIVEIAPGHGGWGIWALDETPGASLKGFDISPQSITIAKSVANAAGVSDRSVYEERNALDLNQVKAESADACICCFLVEHLEQPSQLFAVIAHLLKPGGIAFITGALTAAQVDHIFEFRYESELVEICEKNNLRVLETLSANPRRTLPNARFLPRSMALLVTKRAGSFY